MRAHTHTYSYTHARTHAHERAHTHNYTLTHAKPTDQPIDRLMAKISKIRGENRTITYMFFVTINLQNLFEVIEEHFFSTFLG